MKIADTVRTLAEPVIEGLNAGIELLEVEYVKEGADWYLRIYIDKQGGVTIDDCQLVSEALNDLLDEADSIKGKYQIGSLSNDSDVDYLKIDAGSLTSSKIDKEV